MMCKIFILALAIIAVAARPQHGGTIANVPKETEVNGVSYPELPLDGSECEIGVTYHHFGNLCECKPEHEVSCKRIKKD